MPSYQPSTDPSVEPSNGPIGRPNSNGNIGTGPSSCSFCSDSIGTRSVPIRGNDSLCDGGVKIESEPTENAVILWTNSVNRVECTLIISNIE